MAEIKFKKKKIGLTYLVWLQKGNRYMILEEPAWFVFSKIAKRYKASGIALSCAERYGLGLDESLAFISDIQASLEQINQPVNGFLTENADFELVNYQFQPFSTYYYRFGASLIRFSFETQHYESYLHPLICHLATTDTHTDASVFEIFEYKGKIVFRLNGAVKGLWSWDETHLVKGLIFMNLVNVMYCKTDHHWLMSVHASAVTNGKKTILISASPGSGKTTMAALLHQAGYLMVSDDFVPIDRHRFMAWPFPVAMSIKEGATELISTIHPGIKEKPINHLTAEKSVRYIFPGNVDAFSLQPLPAKEFIFISYNPSVDFQCEKLDLAKASIKLLEQSWVSPSKGSAEILMNQLSQWSFYELTYSNNQKALDTFEKLFNHE